MLNSWLPRRPCPGWLVAAIVFYFSLQIVAYSGQIPRCTAGAGASLLRHGSFSPATENKCVNVCVFCCALKRKTRRGSRRMIVFAHGCTSTAFPWLYWTSAVQLMWDECSFKGGFYPAQCGERERERERERGRERGGGGGGVCVCVGGGGGLEGRDLSPSPVSASVSGNLEQRKHYLCSHEPAGNCHLEFTAIPIWTSSIDIF